MAKRTPSLSLERMENSLGYKVDDALKISGSSMVHFYADLRPIEHGIYARTLREFEELEKQKTCRGAVVCGILFPELGVPKIIPHGGDIVTMTRTSAVGFYSFIGNLQYDFGLTLALLISRNEAFDTMHVAQLKPHAIHGVGPLFSRLPRELREKIYNFALPKGTWKSEDIDSPKCSFLEHVGDPSGFYYPLNSLSILKVNKAMRWEALPLAYRSTMFRLDDMDELIKLLIAIGRVGRDSIKSVEFAWQSRTDLEQQWSRASKSTEHLLTLPTLHVAKCLQLLKQCKNLKFLRIFFDSDLVQDIPPKAYVPDTGIHDLCSIRIEKLEVLDLVLEPLKQDIFVTKLREAMQSSHRETED